MYNLWFDQLAGNKLKLSQDKKDRIRDSFTQGGYYRLDLDEKVTILTLNTLFYDSQRSIELDSGGQGFT